MLFKNKRLIPKKIQKLVYRIFGLDIELDTINFNRNLSAADSDVQKALETLDELDIHVQNTDKKITDADGDTWKNCEITPDIDKHVTKANQTGTGIIEEWRESTNVPVINMKADGSLHFLAAAIDTLIKNVNNGGIGKGIEIAIPNATGGWMASFTVDLNSSGFVVCNYAGKVTMGIGEKDFTTVNAFLANLYIKQTQPTGLKIVNPTGPAEIWLDYFYGNLAGVRLICYDEPSLNSFERNFKIAISTGAAGVFADKFFVNYNGNVGIEVASPTEKLDVAGTIKSTGVRSALSTKTGNYTATKNDHYLKINSATGTRLIQLLDPSTSNHGQEYIIKAIDVTNLITIVAFSKTLSNVLAIENPSGTTFRYTREDGSMTSLDIGKYIKISGCNNAVNNGVFVITGTDASTYFEVANAAGVIEATSPGKFQIPVLDKDMTTLDEVIKFVADSDNDIYEEF